MDSHNKPSGSTSDIDQGTVAAFVKLTLGANLNTLREILKLTNSSIVRSLNSSKESCNIDVEDLFEYVPDILDSTITNSAGVLNIEGESLDPAASDELFLNNLHNELDSLKLTDTESDKVTTQWLMESSLASQIKSLWHRGTPKDINKYPTICKLRDIVNEMPQCVGEMNSCIINCFKDSNVRHRPHQDNEDYIDQNCSISTFSVGVT